MNSGQTNLQKSLPFVVTVSLFLFLFIYQAESAKRFLNLVIAVLSPLIWSVIISYLLNPVVSWFQHNTKLKRPLVVLIVYTVVLIAIVAIIMVISPIIYRSVSQIIIDIPNYIETLSHWYNSRIDDFKSLETFVNNLNLSFQSDNPISIQDNLVNIGNNFQVFMVSLSQTLLGVTSGLLKFVMGMILSVYILLDKERYAAHSKRIILAYLGDARAEEFFEFLREVDTVFGKYLVGKAIDSLIIGLLCYIGLIIINIRYAALFAVVVAVTNMIPYFGPIIGAMPIIIVTVFYSPIKALWVAFFMLVLQQADGNIIGPMILGDRVGMSPLLVIIAIIIGGGLFGIVGMLLGVPSLAVIRNIVNRKVDQRLTPREHALPDGEH